MLIGDSVMVDIGQVFQDKVPKAVIDGKVGRQLIEAKPLVQGSYSNYNSPKQDVVLELGTNGDFTKEQLDELIGTLKDANIYLVTTRVPRDYQNHVNSEIHAAEKQYKTYMWSTGMRNLRTIRNISHMMASILNMMVVKL